MEKTEKICVRRFREEDAKEVSDMICRNFREVNSRDYDAEEIERLCSIHHTEWAKEEAKCGHMYVITEKDKIIACGTISAFAGKKEESILTSIFVLPEFHGKGIGRKVIEVLEQDEYFLRAERIRLAASITACDFYRKLGYEFKNGEKRLDVNRLYQMEKYL